MEPHLGQAGDETEAVFDRAGHAHKDMGLHFAQIKDAVAVQGGGDDLCLPEHLSLRQLY